MDLQKRKRNYYTNTAHQKKRKQHTLEAGIRGFLCTCNFRQKDCIRDAYKILNEFADEMYKPVKPKEPDENDTEIPLEQHNDPSEKNQANEDDDISAALSKEIDDLKAEYLKPAAARRFTVVDTGLRNVIFIKTTLQDPLELVTKIVTELDKTKKQRTRFLLRLLPVEVICKAYMSDIKTKASVLLEKYFAQEPKTFSIVFNRHSNNNIHRDEIIQDIAEIISQKNRGNKADLKNPELAVLVEVIRGVCLISVVPNYYKFKKYNLLEICNVKQKDGAKKQDEGDVPDGHTANNEELEKGECKIDTPGTNQDSELEENKIHTPENTADKIDEVHK